MGKNNLLNWSFCNEEDFSFRPINARTSQFELDKIFNSKEISSDKHMFGKLNPQYVKLFEKLDFSQKQHYHTQQR